MTERHLPEGEPERNRCDPGDPFSENGRAKSLISSKEFIPAVPYQRHRDADRIGVHPPFWNLLAFGRYPLSIYSSYIQFLLSWIIPFGFATFYPSARLLGRAEFRAYAPLIPVVAAAILTVALASWRLGTRRYSSTGS